MRTAWTLAIAFAALAALYAYARCSGCHTCLVPCRDFREAGSLPAGAQQTTGPRVNPGNLTNN